MDATKTAQNPVKMITIKEAAKGLMPENTLRRLCKENKVPCLKIGRRTFINYNALIWYLDNLEASQGIT